MCFIATKGFTHKLCNMGFLLISDLIKTSQMSLFKFTTAVYSNERPSVLAANLSRSLDKIEKNQNMKKKKRKYKYRLVHRKYC